MKILYIITQANEGGAQKYTLTLAKHFGGIIAAGNEAESLFDEARHSSLVTSHLKHLKRNIHPYHDILAIWEIRRLIKLTRPDIVHLNSSKAGFLGSLAGMFLKNKIIFTAHGFIFNEPMPIWQKNFYIVLEKIASDFRDFIITVSDADKNSALNRNLIEKNKIQTIHNGLSAINFLPVNLARQKLGLDESKLIIGTVAGFYKTKGLDVLIYAVAMLNIKILNETRFVILGDGPEFESLKSKIKNLRLQNFIFTPGKINNAQIFFKAFDLFVLPSRKEGLPYTLLEAMQAGLPIIATNVGGNKEALGDSGILCESENPKALANAIMEIIYNEQKKKILSQKSFQRSKLFTEEKMLTETKLVYERLLKN